MFKPINCFNVYPDMYEMNTEGVVRNIQSQHELATIYTAGYPSVFLKTTNNTRTCFYKHRLLGALFIENPNPEVFDCVHHKDTNKENYSLDNLEWTSKEINNSLGRIDTWKAPFKIKLDRWGNSETVGIRNGMNKHSEETIRTICQSLVNGTTHRQAAINAGLEDNENNRLLVTSIANKKRWKSISNEYF